MVRREIITSSFEPGKVAQTLTPFTPVEDIVQRRDNLPVFTTIKLNSLNGTQVKTELAGLLSPRGKIAETGIPNRVANASRAALARA